jgi:Asp-tRNA(Asn)/Glu-tRNA(Gln) amidotransferase A subunit family amidase
VGRTNTPEFGLVPTTEPDAYGPTRNPWNTGYTTGGSSGGSAAAVAANETPWALGSDTGGSIRLPAACCGIVGLKPTYGRVSRAGVMPLSWSLDHVGPMTRTVRDAAVLLSVIAGHDPADATSSRRAVPDYAARLDEPIARLRVGVPENYYWEELDPAVAAAARAAIGTLEELGAELTELRVPDPQIASDVANVLARSESAAVHARVAREAPHALQPAVRARLEVGFHISAYDYLQAARLRARLARTFVRDVLGDVDLLVTPTIPEPAPTVAAVKAGSTAETVRRMGRFSRLTRPFNALGLPALSVPCGFSTAGLPIGLQLVGRPFDEATVLRVGHAYEQAAAWTRRRPPLD